MKGLVAALGLACFSCDSSGTVVGVGDASTSDAATLPDATATGEAAMTFDATPGEAAYDDARDASPPDADAGPGYDAPDPGDAGGCVEMQDPDSGDCNALVNDAALVTYSCGMGAPPQLAGGTLVDGTYVTSSGKDYRPGCGFFYFPTPSATTWQLTGACLKQAGLDEVQGYQVTVNYTVTPLGGGMARLTQTCPPGSSGSSSTTVGYEATDTTFTLFDPGGGTGGTLIVMTKQ